MCFPENTWFGFVLGATLVSTGCAIYWQYRQAWCRYCLFHTVVVLQKLVARGTILSLDDRAVISVAIEYLIKTK